MDDLLLKRNSTLSHTHTLWTLTKEQFTTLSISHHFLLSFYCSSLKTHTHTRTLFQNKIKPQLRETWYGREEKISSSTGFVFVKVSAKWAKHNRTTTMACVKLCRWLLSQTTRQKDKCQTQMLTRTELCDPWLFFFKS